MKKSLSAVVLTAVVTLSMAVNSHASDTAPPSAKKPSKYEQSMTSAFYDENGNLNRMGGGITSEHLSATMMKLGIMNPIKRKSTLQKRMRKPTTRPKTFRPWVYKRNLRRNLIRK